jgi:hypothetical protein
VYLITKRSLRAVFPIPYRPTLASNSGFLDLSDMPLDTCFHAP